MINVLVIANWFPRSPFVPMVLLILVELRLSLPTESFFFFFLESALFTVINL